MRLALLSPQRGERTASRGKKNGRGEIIRLLRFPSPTDLLPASRYRGEKRVPTTDLGRGQSFGGEGAVVR